MEPSLFTETGDICRKRHGGNIASERANARVRKNTDNAAILTIFKRRYRLTSKEIGSELGTVEQPRPLNTFSGRLTWLLKHGFIRDTGTIAPDNCRILEWTGKEW